MQICPCCGETASFGIAEVFPEARELHLASCCNENLSGWIDTIASITRKERASWILSETGLKVKDVIVSGDVLTWTVDFGLRLEVIAFDEAKQFILRHHRHCDPPIGWKFGASVFNGAEMVGVMTAGRPVSAALDRQGCIEVTRVCVNDTLPHALVENACSMLYGRACRQAFERGYSRVVTYTLTTEAGTSLRAAGFVPVARSAGGSWHRKSRPRSGTGSTEPKIRWERWEDSHLVASQLRLPLVA
jgi:hypothetical protein